MDEHDEAKTLRELLKAEKEKVAKLRTSVVHLIQAMGSPESKERAVEEAEKLLGETL